MRIPLKWVQEFTPVRYPADVLAEKLMMAGIDIKGVHMPPAFLGIVTGKVLRVSKVPKADKLRLASVDIGKGVKLSIICGAPNLKTGQTVAVATVGAVLPGGFKIQEKEIRGAKSQGMICSAAELGLEEKSDGIMVLKNVPAGRPLAYVLDLDTVIEADITPNRGDQLSILGIAREVAALNHKRRGRITMPPMRVIEGPELALKQLKISVKDKKLARQYVARVIKVKSIGESPAWMQARLKAVGVRPINAVVDITNYVMFELGQPLHAFDHAKLRGREIIVRRARVSEKIKTIDGKTRKLDKSMLVIADEKYAVAVAGVMGGAESEVSEQTKTIVLEAAEFEPIHVRKTAQALGLRSEAVTRFEKKIDPNLPQFALERAAFLLKKYCGGVVSRGVLYQGPAKIPVTEMSISIKDVNSLLGARISISDAISALRALGFDAVKEADVIKVTAPSFRRDMEIREDLIEEIARVIGYEKLPKHLPLGKLKDPQRNSRSEFAQNISRELIGMGLYEAMTYSFVSAKWLRSMGIEPSDAISIENPLSNEHEYMRPNILPSLLDAAGRNLRFRKDVKLFELANVYEPDPKLFRRERFELTAVAVNDAPYRSLKGVVEALAIKLRLNLEFKRTSGWPFHPGRVAEIVIGDQTLGVIGEIHPKVRAAFDIELPAAAFVFDFESLYEAYSELVPVYQQVTKFPPVLRDISFFVKENVDYEELVGAVNGASERVSASLLDIYRGKPTPKGKKSVALSLEFTAGRTLTDKEIDTEFARIEKALETKGATIRKS